MAKIEEILKEKDQQTLKATLTDRYNSLLSLAKSNQDQAELLIRSMSMQLNYQAQQNAIAQQLRMANALTIYSLMPRYTPPQSIDMNVTLSDCTKLPALCVGR
jgi:hypothetical protein